jgi:hypothetical protein
VSENKQNRYREQISLSRRNKGKSDKGGRIKKEDVERV